ncbi:PIN domain-containing protein [uncultured Sphingobacterium sp.]|uniref:PIN domain-containing protein n=1 Tax=uncultured Sphingobacterium sp. TaxID=182688 RepID=UPI0025E9AA88|nr:PIN domain-containing protein [uncultured Sphingobacterium sp.]
MSKEQEFDIFHNNYIYEKADQIFITVLPKIEEIKDNCIFVLDTNALLVPFATGSESLDEIGKILSKLKEQKQLIIPDQVAKEFANNRPKKIGEMFQTLNKKRNGINDPKIGSYPLLEKLDGYRDVLEIEKKIKDILKEYNKAIGKLVDTVKDWTWDDPVSKLYRQLFTPEIIYLLQFERSEVIEKLRYRYKHKIPPGFKDGGKEDEGIGDLLIWFSILEIAQKYQKNIVFVSGDEKTDWYHRSDNIALYPRFELLAEFKNKCNSLSFHIIKLSELLTLMGAKDAVVSEVKIEEQLESDLELSRYSTPNYILADRAVYLYYKKMYDAVFLPKKDIGDFDFEYLDQIGKRVPVNVILINDSISTAMRRTRDKLIKMIHRNLESNFTYEFVIVTSNQEINTSELITKLRMEIYNLFPLTQAYDLRIYAGFLDEKNIFTPIA